MSSSVLKDRYAKALFALAQRHDVVEKIAQDLQKFGEVCAADTRLREVLANPVLHRSELLAALSAILEKLSVHELLQRFVAVLVANRRVAVLEKIIAPYEALVRAWRGEQLVEVISAVPLTKEQVHKLQTLFATIFTKNVVIKQQVDASILGGLIIKTGCKMIDHSLLHQIGQLKFLSKQALGNT